MPGGAVAVLLNPAAGRRRQRALVPELLRRLRAGGYELDVVSAGSPAEAEQDCAKLLAAGVHALIAIGGDGTVHTAVQAVAGSGAPFAVVPAGTGNDFAAAVGVPTDPLTAADQVARALRDGVSTRPVDLARVTGANGAVRWFAAVMAAGFDAVVNERANAMSWPRGDRRYDLAIFLELARLRARDYRVVLDGSVLQPQAILVAVGNTASYGGGIRICPGADPCDGLLDVVVGRAMSRRTLVRLRGWAYRGVHVRHRLVDAYRARTVELHAEGITTYADGERCLPLPVTIECVPGALRLLRP